MARSCKVAVIGAGVAGLVAARELRREGHRVVVFEKGDRVGGTWVYDPRADSDRSGRDPDRQVVHGRLYRSLRTNFPRELMGFLDFPFSRSYGDQRAFPAHEEVLSFLEDFAREFVIIDLVRLRTEVVRVAPSGGGGRKDEWVVESRREGAAGPEAEVFQAVVVCNGHYTEPRFAEIPGIHRWPGKQIHSHNYRIPEPFQDQRREKLLLDAFKGNQADRSQIVVIIGKGASANDLYREIAKVAKEVHLASRSTVDVGKLDEHDNVWQHSMINCVHEDGKVDFDDGSSHLADVIFHCTGYKYRFPFLETNETVSIDDNRVGPLYKHVFPPHLQPWLSFVGLPQKAILFLMMELQSKWVAQVLSGKLSLPPEDDMMTSVNQLYLQMEEIGRPKWHTHTLHPSEIEYMNWLAAEVGLPPIEGWREQMYVALIKILRSNNDGYRDTWDADYWIQQSQFSHKRARSCL